MKRKKITVKNEMPHLLAAVTNHPDCPDWLIDAIWDTFNDNAAYVTNSAVYWAAQMESANMRADSNATLNAEFIQEGETK